MGVTNDMGRAPLRLQPGEWPLTGRDHDLRIIRAAIADGRQRGVLVVGAAGAGKSRLARAVLADAEARGAVTAVVVGTEAARAIPLGAFSQFLPAVASAREPLELLREVTAEVRRRADGRRLVLAVDDADRLDPVSATLVHQLALGDAAFVVITARAGELLSDAIVNLWKDQEVTRLELPPLSPEAYAELCGAVLGGEMERTTQQRLWDVTQGNPLFLHELVVEGLERGMLTGQEGVWRWRGPFGTATRLRELVEQRLARLDPGERRALEVLAFGEPLAADLLEAIAGTETVASLEAHDQLRVSRDGSRAVLRLAEPLYGEVLRASVPPLRARAIQRSLADAVEATPLGRRDDFLRVAHWRLEGGGATDPGALLTAARHAESSFDFALAERLAVAAIDAGAGTLARRVLASALRGQGRSQDAEAVWATLQSTAADDDELVEAVSGRSMNLLFGLGLADEATDVLDAASRAVLTSTANDTVAVLRALVALYAGRPCDALAIATQVLDAVDQTPENAVYAAVAAAPALAVMGRTAEAHAVADRNLPLAFQLGPEDGVVDASQLGGLLLAAKFLAYMVNGDVTAGYAVASTVHGLAVEAGSQDGIAGLGCALGLAHLDAGRPRRAIHEFRQAAVLLRDVDRNRYLPWCLAALAQALVIAGDIDAAADALRAADEERTLGLQMFAIDVERARAWLAAARDEPGEAHRILMAAADDGEKAQQIGFVLQALHDAIRLGRCDAALVERLRTNVALTDSAFGARALAHGEALLAGDGTALEAVADQFEQSGAMLLAAEILANAAACHRAAGRPDRAMVVAGRARDLLAGCEGARPPAFSLLTADAPALTRREREVAAMAAGGLASKVIAERLFLSVRTVDNHLHRAYDKLGVRSRRELADLLGGAAP